jgi:hypothetical protein
MVGIFIVNETTCSLHFDKADFKEAEKTCGSIGVVISIMTPPCLSFTNGRGSALAPFLAIADSGTAVEFAELDMVLLQTAPLCLVPAPKKLEQVNMWAFMAQITRYSI